MKKSENKDLTKDCKGCLSMDPSDLKLPCIYMSYFKTNQNGKCPCSNCLVKVVCEEACEDLMQLAKEIRTKRTKTKHKERHEKNTQ